MWRQGFSIDDGDLRPYNDPANRAFLSSVMRGSIPDELVHMAQGGEVHVDMEDHKEEEFVKPKVSERSTAIKRTSNFQNLKYFHVDDPQFVSYF